LPRVDGRRLLLRGLRGQVWRSQGGNEQGRRGNRRAQPPQGCVLSVHQKFTRVVKDMLRMGPTEVTLPNVAEFATVESPE
jgi:hypothetical protein